jgi:hypothetical protein
MFYTSFENFDFEYNNGYIEECDDKIDNTSNIQKKNIIGLMKILFFFEANESIIQFLIPKSYFIFLNLNIQLNENNYESNNNNINNKESDNNLELMFKNNPIFLLLITCVSNCHKNFPNLLSTIQYQSLILLIISSQLPDFENSLKSEKKKFADQGIT